LFSTVGGNKDGNIDCVFCSYNPNPSTFSHVKNTFLSKYAHRTCLIRSSIQSMFSIPSSCDPNPACKKTHFQVTKRNQEQLNFHIYKHSTHLLLSLLLESLRIVNLLAVFMNSLYKTKPINKT